MGDIFSLVISLVIITALLFFGPALSAIAIRRSLSIPWQLVLLAVCVFYSIFPILLTLGGTGLAERFACEVGGGGIIIFNIYTCPGTPWLGGVITLMTFAHLGAIITIPSGVLGFVGFLISLILKTNRLRTGVNTPERPTATFYRSRRRKVIAGVCAAIAQRWGLSLLGVRVAIVVLSVVITGIGLAIYLWVWLAFPLEPSPERRQVG
ncbi:PspC domain-containing protein [Coleofasciculus sp. FACHB-64]|uniref:PspC domain-containing protein n=1 Tax=Cyanophyceae TaxID=3028117 RepID=UPI001685A82D|nr:PspC domain-containing protein [Coleofasciculus sp. FACHB-64]MBD2048117.1 PspC domain-containing protein [Coleofasciculus sp. FACHB-64]